MLRKSLIIFMIGVLATAAAGLLNIISINLVSDPREYTQAFKLFSLPSVIFSFSLFHLSKIEARKDLRVSCIIFAIAYSLCILSTFIPSEAATIKVVFLWAKFIVETGMMLLAAIVLLRNTMQVKNEI